MVLVVLAAAVRWGLAESVFTSVAGMLLFNFYFLPPIGTLTIATMIWTFRYGHRVRLRTLTRFNTAHGDGDPAIQGQ